VAAVVGGLCGTGNCGSSKDSSTNDGSTARNSDVAQYISSITGQQLRYPVPEGATASPEEMALTWLIQSDPLQLRPTVDPQRLAQRFAILVLWFGTTVPPGNNDTWIKSTGWLQAKNECDWFGITCGDMQVSEISLSKNNLQGRIPDDLGLLTALALLVMDVNNLSGTLPTSFERMTLLEDLDISTQYLTGTLPNEWRSLTNLKTRFSVGQNRLNGSLPSWLGLLTDLEAIRVDNNRFTGTIPSSIANLDQNTHQAWFFNNNFKGTIPYCDSSFSGNLTILNLRADCDVCPCCVSTQCCPGADFC
jgi:hypothetical protein